MRNPAFRLSSTSAARLSFVLSLGLTLAAPFAGAPALYAQQSGTRTDLAIESDVLKALSTYPDISSERITATTANGVVTLNGSASTDTARNQAQVVAATVDGVRSVVNHVAISNDSSAQPGVSNAAQQTQPPQNESQQPVQQAQSSDPNQQQQDQPAYPQSSQPQAGSSGNWGKAGPPPDVQNGQIPAPPQGSDQQGSAQQAPNQQPQNQPPQNQPPQSAQQGDQYPMQDPGQEEGQPGQNYPQQQQNYPQQRPPYPGGQYPASQYPGGQYPGNPNPSNQYPGGQYPANQYPPRRTQAYVAPKLPTSPVTIPPGTLFTVRTSEPLDSRTLLGGEPFQAIAAQDVYEGDYLAIPRGAVVTGRVVGVKKPGAFRGGAGFALQITALNMSGRSYPVATDTFATDTRGKGGYTTANTVGGAAIGALIGAVAGGGPGAAIGAAAGGAGGLGVSAATPGPREVMPPETLLTFHLHAPLTVNPVSSAEVQRLASSLPPPRRVMRPRPYPYGYGYPPPPPYYYRPYPY